MTALIEVLTGIAGAAAGIVLTLRSLPRIVARMSPAERVAFARKVTRLAEIREVK